MGLLLLAPVAVLVFLLLRSRRGGGSAPSAADGAPKADPLAGLRVWLSDPRYRVFVGDEALGETMRARGWVELDGKNPPVAVPTRYAVAYRNGELVALEPKGPRIPDGLRWIAPSALPVPDLPDDTALAAGADHVQVRFLPSPHGGQHHRVVLTNVSATPVRVTWFGAWAMHEGALRFSTITGRPFTGEQFCAWYAVPDPDGWIAPGASVDDPANYGAGLWIWAFETPSGARFFVSGRRAG